MGKAETHLYIKFSNLLKDKFGYADVLNYGGDEAFEELMNYGTIAGANGKRIRGKDGRELNEREWDIAKLIEDGEPLYIYKNGDKYPTKVQYNPQTEEFEVDPKPINEMPMPVKPEKPGLFWRFFNIIPAMFGTNFPSVKRWKDYNREIEARQNVVEKYRVDRRTNYYKEIKDKYKAKEPEKKEPAKEAVKEAQPQAPQAAAAAAEKQKSKDAQIEKLFGISADEARKRSEAARAKAKAAAEAKTPEQQIWELKAQKLEIDKKIAELEKQAQMNKETPAAALKDDLTTIDEVDEALEDEPEVRESEGDLIDDDEPEDLIDDDEPETLVDDDEPESLIDDDPEEIAAAEEEGPLIDEDVDLIGLSELEQMADERSAAEAAQGADGSQGDANTEQKEAPASTIDILIENLEADGTQLSDTAKGNLWAMYLNAQQGKKEIEEAVNNPNVERISGGEAVEAIVAFEHIKSELASGNKQQVIQSLNKEGAAKEYQKVTRLSKDVVYAADYDHNKEFFQKNFLEDDGVAKMSQTVDKSVNNILVQENLFGIRMKDPTYQARVEAEKKAMEEERKRKELEEQQKKMMAQQGGMVL